uniref:Uncharacterized protein n=1 Tax=Knipowitschia caucasica TaxID=637954 RepID=A0AAV2LBH5_KNICA
MCEVRGVLWVSWWCRLSFYCGVLVWGWLFVGVGFVFLWSVGGGGGGGGRVWWVGWCVCVVDKDWCSVIGVRVWGVGGCVELGGGVVSALFVCVMYGGVAEVEWGGVWVVVVLRLWRLLKLAVVVVCVVGVGVGRVGCVCGSGLGCRVGCCWFGGWVVVCGVVVWLCSMLCMECVCCVWGVCMVGLWFVVKVVCVMVGVWCVWSAG